jgi:hypothetical protein
VAAAAAFSNQVCPKHDGNTDVSKSDQIIKTGAAYAITPCHNCHAQVHDLSEHYEGGWHTVHLWTLICLSLGVLGENEREYLGPDLKEVGL